MPEGGELLGDQRGGALLLETKLGMGADIAAARGQLVMKRAHSWDQLHGSPPLRAAVVLPICMGSGNQASQHFRALLD